jgi:hypothetical protein
MPLVPQQDAVPHIERTLPYEEAQIALDKAWVEKSGHQERGSAQECDWKKKDGSLFLPSYHNGRGFDLIRFASYVVGYVIRATNLHFKFPWTHPGDVTLKLTDKFTPTGCN